MTIHIPVWLFWIVGVPVGIILLVLAWLGYQAVRMFLEAWDKWY